MEYKSKAYVTEHPEISQAFPIGDSSRSSKTFSEVIIPAQVGLEKKVNLSRNGRIMPVVTRIVLATSRSFYDIHDFRSEGLFIYHYSGNISPTNIDSLREALELIADGTTVCFTDNKKTADFVEGILKDVGYPTIRV